VLPLEADRKPLSPTDHLIRASHPLVKVLKIELLPLEQRERLSVCHEQAGIGSTRIFSHNGLALRRGRPRPRQRGAAASSRAMSSAKPARRATRHLDGDTALDESLD
jgi:hypothetical protein